MRSSPAGEQRLKGKSIVVRRLSLLTFASLLVSVFIPSMSAADKRGGTGFVKAFFGPTPKTADGHLDVARTIEALKRIGANAIVLQPAYDKQWEDILNFLPAATRSGIKVFLLLPDARHGVGPCGCGKEWWWHLPKPFCKDYVKWMEALARLSLEYPALEGVFINDFECGAFSPKGGFTVEYIRRVMQAKNRVNPKFKFLPGIYLPRGLCDFEITQKGGYVAHMRRLVLSASYSCERPPREARLLLITHERRSDYFVQRLSVNGEVVFADALKGGPRMVEVDLKVFNPRRWRIEYEILHTGFVNWFDHFVSLWLFVDGRRVPLRWRVESDDEHFSCVEYATGKLRPYYELTDGVIFWSNAFDLLKPENEIFEELMKVARERVGEGKVIFGHFYGAEPWREPIFPSDYYFDTFVKLNVDLTDGVSPWFACLLPYFVGYSSGIYTQPENDRPEYDFRFRYPAYTSYELGFFQGIAAEIDVPKKVWDAKVTFYIEDDRKEEYAGRWVKELVFVTGKFEHEPIPRKEFLKPRRLWFKEVGTVWFDFVEGDEGRQRVVVPFEKLKKYLLPGRRATLVLRMGADMFRGASSAPPEVNVYVTRPKVTINGKEINARWRFVSGNALEPLWLKSSRKVAELFRSLDTSGRPTSRQPSPSEG